MINYSRNILFSIRNSYKTYASSRHGRAHVLTTETWNRLASFKLLSDVARGQRGRNHLRHNNFKPIKSVLLQPRKLDNRFNRCLGVNKFNLLNIQVDTFFAKKRTDNTQSTSRIGNKRSENTQATSLINIAHLNIRSLRNRSHFLEARDLVTSRNIDVFTVSESWLNTSVKNAEIEIEGYKLYRLDRLHKTGGGVCTYVRNNLKASILKDISHISETNFHQQWIQLQLKNIKSILLCVAYRPPDCGLECFQEFFLPNYHQALMRNKPIFVLGDLNCNLLKTCAEGTSLNNIIQELNLTQLINSPTRITNSSESLIDVILTSSPTLVKSYGVIHRSISDHLPVYVEVNLKPLKQKPLYVTSRSFKNYVPDAFAQDVALQSDLLQSIISVNNVNDKLTILNEIMTSTLEQHAPLKSIKIKSRPCPFINAEIKEIMKTRDSLHRLFIQTRETSTWNDYKYYRTLVKHSIKDAENNFHRNEIYQHKNNPRSMWKTIHRCIPTKERTKPVYSKDDHTVASEFNQYFSSVGRNVAKLAKNLATNHNFQMSNPLGFSNTSYYKPEEMFSFKQVTSEEVKRVVMSIPSNKAPGIDQMPMRIVKDCLQSILPCLTDIINCSFLTSTFPSLWKSAIVVPLLKDGDPEIPSNNRPLSLLPVTSKICERIALNQFTDHLSSKGCLTPHQSGNKKFHSTETLNIHITDSLLTAMNKQKVTALLLLDLSKAFDSVDHQILLHKLKNIGASQITLDWFKSYLSDRIQCVRIGSTLSSNLLVTQGVPQGAILSPLLFCIYTNDLPHVPRSCQIESFVDDSKILLSFHIKSIDEIIERLESDLKGIAKWCCENKLLINPVKTKFLIIGTRQQLVKLPDDISLNFLDKTLRPSNSAKDLGIILDSNLTYDSHITNLVSSCMSRLYQINRVRNSFDQDTLTLIINALVISKLLYCSIVWSNTSMANINKLQLVQNFAARVITGTYKFDHITPIRKLLNWLTVKDLLKYRELLMTFKCIHGQAPLYLTQNFVYRTKLHRYDTRHKNNLNIPLFKTTTGQRCFQYRSVKLWNSLTDELRNITNFQSFKKRIKSTLLDMP